MSALTYERLVDELFPRLAGGIRWGLERTERLLASVGNPHHRYPSLHIGGTNGKGSVSATSASILRAYGLRTGLYTSPHLCTFRERIQIDGAPISEAALLHAANRLWPAIQAEGASFFEATTAIAFLALADANVDIAVIEVGLGGRLDSTNVITPLVAVVTNVSLDHVQLLGNTIGAVAREKAGIIKPKVPLVTGEAAGVAADVLAARANQVGAPMQVVPQDAVVVTDMTPSGTTFRYTDAERGIDRQEITTPLIGAHQAWNTAIALQAMRLLPRELRPSPRAEVEGIAAVVWPGRMQVEHIAGSTWIFDVAHNVAGVGALVSTLERLDVARPRTVLVGVLGDKDWANMLLPLRSWADRLIITAPPTAPADRRWDAEGAAAAVAGEGTIVQQDFVRALQLAADPTAGTGTVVVTGSFHTVGDALTSLQRAPWGSDAALPHVDFSG